MNDLNELVLELRECQNSAHIRLELFWELFDEAAATILALRQHAEAMANGVEGKVYYADAPDVCEAVDAYRRDFPKDAP